MTRGECLSLAHDPTDLPPPRDGPSAVAVHPPPAPSAPPSSTSTAPPSRRRCRSASTSATAAGSTTGTPRGFDAWAFDFAGFGESGRYAAMSEPADRHPPLGRAPEAARQVADVVALIQRETGGASRWSRTPGAARPRRLPPSPARGDRSPGPVRADRAAHRRHAGIAARLGRRHHRGAIRPLRRGRAEGPSRRCSKASTAGRRPISRAIPTPRYARRPPCASPTARAPTTSTPGPAVSSGILRGSPGRSPSCAAPGIRSAATPMRR